MSNNGDHGKDDLRDQVESRSTIQLTISSVAHSQYLRLFHSFISRRQYSNKTADFIRPLWLLGVCYDDSALLTSSPYQSSTNDFIRDFESRLRFTYRKDLEPFHNSNLTSDVGWGCMIRSGQMVLAQALISRHLGRSWRRDSSVPDVAYLQIVKQFVDFPSIDCPLSIHNVIQAGASHGLKPGAWLGPSVMCHTLRYLSVQEAVRPVLAMAVYVAYGDKDGGGAPMLCLDDIVKVCLSYGDVSQADSWQPVLILIPLMLGSDKVNPRYLTPLKQLFTFPQSLGMMAGKPGGAVYVVGLQNDDMIYLDPHEVQPLCEVNIEKGIVDTSSYHCSEPRKMALEGLDPSVALAFLCNSQEELEDFCLRAQELSETSKGAPLFTVGLHSDNLSACQLDVSSDVIHSGPPIGGLIEDDWQLV